MHKHIINKLSIVMPPLPLPPTHTHTHTHTHRVRFTDNAIQVTQHQKCVSHALSSLTHKQQHYKILAIMQVNINV